MPRWIYTLLLSLALPLLPFKLLWRGIKQPAYLKHWGERFGVYSTEVSKPIIWLHCVSVGETRAAATLVDALITQYPDHQVLITHTTPTGRETSAQLFGHRVERVYLPYDVPFAVNRFLTHFRPSISLLMETELWFNLIAECRHRHIPILLVNARLSERSARGYANLGELVPHGLNRLTVIAAQTKEDAMRFEQLGAEYVTVMGNLKFDITPPAESLEQGLALRQKLGKTRTVFLAASTRDGEEALILDAVKGLDVLTVIVPRHPQRFNEVANLIEKRGLNYVRRSNLTKQINSDVSIVLGDSMGELFSYYAACDFAFVGGSLLPLGGQNLIEAALMGKPILIGPHTFNFAQASQQAIECGAAVLVEDAKALKEKIIYLSKRKAERQKMADAAVQFSQNSVGATTHILDIIKEYLAK